VWWHLATANNALSGALENTAAFTIIASSLSIVTKMSPRQQLRGLTPHIILGRPYRPSDWQYGASIDELDTGMSFTASMPS